MILYDLPDTWDTEARATVSKKIIAIMRRKYTAIDCWDKHGYYGKWLRVPYFGGWKQVIWRGNA